MDQKTLNDLREIFNKHDPIGIFLHKDVNFDEYDSELEGMIIRFNRSKNLDEFVGEVHNVFENMFSPEVAGPKKKYIPLATDVYNYIKENKLGAN